MATWLFGRQQKTWASWEELYKDYLQAAACLEHVFLSQLRTELSNLPLRLKQLVTPYPLEKLALTENSCETRILRLEDWDALHIILLGPAGAASEVAQTSRWSPATILATALKANYQEGVDETLRAAWSALSESSAMKQDEGHEARNIVVDETKRIFDLVAERAEKKNRFRFTTETRFPAYGHNYGNRRRSVSIDVGMMQSTSSKSSG